MRLLITNPEVDKTFVRSEGVYLYDEEDRAYPEYSIHELHEITDWLCKIKC
jgi:hypothetical protein